MKKTKDKSKVKSKSAKGSTSFESHNKLDTCFLNNDQMKMYLDKFGHEGIRHGLVPQVHLQLPTPKQNTLALNLTMLCPGCNDMFQPIRDIPSHLYGRRKTYVAYSCRTNPLCDKSKAKQEKAHILSYIRSRANGMVCRPFPSNPSYENEMRKRRGRPKKMEAVI